MIDGRNIHLDAGRAGHALGKRTLFVALTLVFAFRFGLVLVFACPPSLKELEKIQGSCEVLLCARLLPWQTEKGGARLY